MTYGRIYILLDRRLDRFKIGFTTRTVPARRRQIEGAIGYSLEPIGSYLATFQEEREAHRLLKPWRLGGEWYRRCPEVVEWITSDPDVA